MSKETINVDGEDVVVREDTAKAYRGTYWFLGFFIVGVIAIALIMILVFGIPAISDGELNQPETKTGETLN